MANPLGPVTSLVPRSPEFWNNYVAEYYYKEQTGYIKIRLKGEFDLLVLVLKMRLVDLETLAYHHKLANRDFKVFDYVTAKEIQDPQLNLQLSNYINQDNAPTSIFYQGRQFKMMKAVRSTKWPGIFSPLKF